jgi:hypothetical protein
MARNDRVSLLREQRVRSFADAMSRFSGENFRLARTAAYDVNSLVLLYMLVAKIDGDLHVRGARVAYL